LHQLTLRWKSLEEFCANPLGKKIVKFWSPEMMTLGELNSQIQIAFGIFFLLINKKYILWINNFAKTF